MMLSKLRKTGLLPVIVIGTLAVGLAGVAPAAGQDADAQAQIENAMSAAPSSVSANATILAYELDDAGAFVVLQEGSNGWYCLPDDSNTPDPDPMCFDETWLDWVYAKGAGEDPNVTAPGFAYMLQGGSEASNTDPDATEPAEGEAWMISPPHIMILLPGGLGQSGLSSDFDEAGPWIMYEGTPFEHIMLPVGEGMMGDMGAMAEATPAT
jgi:hypothetical protein